MTRFVQAAPELRDPYATDRQLLGWLDRLLGPDGHAAAKDRLAALAADVLGPLRAAHHDAEAHPPALTRYDAWGARIERIDSSPGWERQRVAAAEHALVALPYGDLRGTWGAGTRVVQFALLYLYGPESATFTCPVAMADGAAALLTATGAAPEYRQRLLSTDPAVAITSGQWMTESQGGSDIGRSTTTARRFGDGSWRLTGDKWFCSAIDSAMAVALARPEGAGEGSRHLVPFLVPRYGNEGVQVLRLKDKLGTRAVPTGEVRLDDAVGIPLSDPAQPGLATMMTLVVVTRLHNAVAAAGGMKRGLEYALSYARQRTVASGRLVDSPLHRATLGTLAVDAAGAFALAAHAFELLGRAEAAPESTAAGSTAAAGSAAAGSTAAGSTAAAGSAAAGSTAAGADEAARAAASALRLVAPLAKLTTARLAVASASEYLECFGGAGYVENTGIPRLLRDAQVLPIWEGTTNVLSLDVLRALRGSDALRQVLARMQAAIDAASTTLPDAAEALATAARRLAGDAEAAASDPRSERVQAGARGLALRMGYALAAALLIEHAAGAHDEAATIVATLWTLRYLAQADISDEANRYFEHLVG